MSEFQERRAAAAEAAVAPPVEVKVPAANLLPPRPRLGPVLVAPAVAVVLGQRVTIKKGRVSAVVTKAPFVPGKKQELVECKKDDGSIQEYWFDEIE